MKRLGLRTALIVVVLPFAIAVAGIALSLAWLPDVPATVVTHWTFDGTADGFGPSWSTPVLLAIIGLGVPALFAVVLGSTMRPHGPTATQKVLGVASVFAATVLTVAATGSMYVQRGVTAADPTPDIVPVMVAGFAAGVVLAAAAWFLLPKAVPGRSTRGGAVPTIPVSPDERVAWVGIARFGTWAIVALTATVVLVTGVVIWVIAARGLWWLAILPVVIGLAVLGTASWSVRVDAAGLTVRGALGWPRYRVTLAELASAGVTEVTPLGEFGGYGVRFGLGRRLGIITRGGEALEALRRDGRAVVVTVDDAGTAAGLLTALAARSAKGSAKG